MINKSKLEILSFSLIVWGISIVFYYSGWEVALGMLCFISGNNIERTIRWKEKFVWKVK